MYTIGQQDQKQKNRDKAEKKQTHYNLQKNKASHLIFRFIVKTINTSQLKKSHKHLCDSLCLLRVSNIQKRQTDREQYAGFTPSRQTADQSQRIVSEYIVSLILNRVFSMSIRHTDKTTIFVEERLLNVSKTYFTHLFKIFGTLVDICRLEMF